MRVFQILRDEVLVINEDKQYKDTVSNFKTDSGLSLNNLTEVVYDNTQECCVVNKEFLTYPNNTFENYINNVETYITAKEQREYVPPVGPTLEELKESKISEAKAEFARKRDAVRFIQVDDTNTYGFDCASEDITNFLAAYTALTNNVAKSTANTTMYKVWLNETDKGIVELNLEQMNKVFDTVRTSQFEDYAWLSTVEAQIEAATSKQDLEAIVIS